MKECENGHSIETGQWLKIRDYDGCCDECGNPHKFKELICTYVTDFMRNETKLHHYMLSQEFTCFSCGKIIPGINVYCGELDSGLKLEEAVEVVREEINHENN